MFGPPWPVCPASVWWFEPCGSPRCDSDRIHSDAATKCFVAYTRLESLEIILRSIPAPIPLSPTGRINVGLPDLPH